jgi:beta-1,4-mannosyltransferase
VAPQKFFPLNRVARLPVDLLQLDWPHDWYRGKNAAAQLLKSVMYRSGLRSISGRPVVWTVHNLVAHDAVDVDGERRNIQRLIDVCNGVVVFSRAAEEALRFTYRVSPATLVAVTRHGHYIDCYPNRISRAEARDRLALPADSRVVLSLGRLQRYKGIENLVDAFRNVAGAKDVLLIAGLPSDAEYAAGLRNLCDQTAREGRQVRYDPRLVPDDELQIYFNACDIVALPFRQILNSGSVLMAMSFGCPIIAPRHGSIPEIACRAAWFGYDLDDPSGLTGALREALSAPSSDAVRRAVLDFTRRNCDWQHVGRSVAGLYSDVLHSEALGRLH